MIALTSSALLPSPVSFARAVSMAVRRPTPFANATPIPAAAAVTPAVAADLIPDPSADPMLDAAAPTVRASPASAVPAEDAIPARPRPNVDVISDAPRPAIGPSFANSPDTCVVTGRIHVATDEPRRRNGENASVAAADTYCAIGAKAPLTVEPMPPSHDRVRPQAFARPPPTIVASDVNAFDACRAPIRASRPSALRPLTSDTARSTPPMDPAIPVNADVAARASVHPACRFCAISRRPPADAVVWVVICRAASAAASCAALSRLVAAVTASIAVCCLRRADSSRSSAATACEDPSPDFSTASRSRVSATRTRPASSC
jgi:hypothetical protein